MELDADEAAVLDDGGDPFGRRRRGGRVGGVRVREVIRIAGRVAVERRPADPRHALALDSRNPARNKAEARDAAVLVALLERELEPETDAERRPLAHAQRVGYTALVEPAHRAAGRADARQDREVRALDGARVRRDRRVDPEPAQCDRNATRVAGAVVAHDDVHSEPFVDGTPTFPCATATRSALP